MADLKQVALQICRQTLAAIDIPLAMQRKLAREGSSICVNGERVDVSRFRRICVVSIGKASVAMARGLADVLAPDFQAEGIIVAPASPQNAIPGFRTIVAGHPLPDENSFEAGRCALDFLASADESALVFFLLSGGGSSLIELPLDQQITLSDFQALNRCLITCGAPIEEINAVRKHLSAVKGGRLAAAAPAATKITLAITDVPDGQESALASGPTLPDPSTVHDARATIDRYGLLSKLPARIRARFESSASILETPKQGNPAFLRNTFQILLGRDDLFHPAHRCAESRGFRTLCDNATDNWPVERAADYLLAELEALKSMNSESPVAVIADGEVSSPVTGDGIGGRNSAFVLDCVRKIANRPIAVLSVGTDGVDGSSPAAGAVADGNTLARAHALGLDPNEYFLRSDSHTFFSQLGDAIVTGRTGNNLRDLRILLAR